ncbi:uncharacterized protein LOC123524730 [Mercenaria mercenaria]|uniref:uncharacterized protein LOC123524730 n=1 Tax=Mercenaria mercenaria TaxID=6596 RepID=UPI00234ECC6F|nr:uncharacterized protein LOC123524730 [Mercenaria mercenaria]
MNTEADFTDEGDNVLSLLEYMPSGVLLEIFKFLDWNDICQVASTCTKFRGVCSSATLWLRLKVLDFRACAIPDAEKILHVLQKTPNAGHIILGDIITEDTDAINSNPADNARDDYMSEEDEENEDDARGSARHNLTVSDRFVLDVIKCCPRITHLELHMHKITDMSVNAICAKCTCLQTLELHDNPHIQNEAVCELVSLNPAITQLVIDSCEELEFLEIRHTDPTQHLSLTNISFLGQKMVISNVQTLVQSCPYLTHLDLTASQYLDRFSFDTVQGQRSALDCLQVIILKLCKDLQLISLPYCPNLQQLDTSYCSSLKEITATSPKLSQLDTTDCEQVTKIDLTSSDIQELCCKGMELLNTLQIGSDQLTSLDLSECSSLLASNALDAVTNKSVLISLNICGCKNILPDDVNSTVLPQLTGLKTLKYGGHSWTSVALSSENITDFEFSSCINTTCVLLNSPSIKHVTLNDCRDFSEQELMDSFLHGKLVTRMQGLESLVSDHKEKPFCGNSGVPNLCTLKCHSLPGLHGDILSHDLRYFSSLSTVEFVHCTFIAHVTVSGWPSLKSLKIISCNRLNSVSVGDVHTLQDLDVRWCGMVQDFTLRAENLKSLDVRGTNFAHLNIFCDKLNSLQLNGVCTQPKHTICLRCRCLRELSVTKCDRLTDTTVTDLVEHNPQLQSLSLIGTLSLRCLSLPSSIKVCSLTGHRTLKKINLASPITVQHLTLNNLPKLVPEERQMLLKQCEESLRILEVRAIPGETYLQLQLQNLCSLTLDQGIHLSALDIQCSKLRYLRIQGCPKLNSLTLHVESLTQVQVYHSAPLLALRCLSLHSKQVLHLARVLAYYCPKLEELSLYGSEIKGSQLYGLGQSLHSLHTVTLHHCNVGELERQGHSLMIDSSVIDRYNEEHLLVHFIDC